MAAMLGGVAFVAANLFLIGADYDEFSSTVGTTRFTTHTILFWSAAVLLLLGLVALYARHASSAGTLGLGAFLVAFVGTALAVGTAWSETFVLPVLADESPGLVDEPPDRVAAGLWMSLPLFLLGWLLFAISALRARVLPRRPTMAVLAALFLFIPAFALPGLGAFFGAALVWLAYATLAETPDA